VVVRYRY